MSRSFLLWIVVTLLTIGMLAAPHLWPDAPQWLGYAMGGATLVALGLMYIAVIKPVSTVIRGMDLLKGQDFSSRLAPVGQVDADNLVKLFNSLMEQLRSERLRQHEQNSFLSLLIDASPMGVVIFDFDKRITRLNAAACTLMGVTTADARGATLASLPGQVAACAAALKAGETETVNLNHSGGGILRLSRLWFMEMGFRREFLLIENLTDEVRKAEKATFSKMVRLMAHEVNNTMGGIHSALETLMLLHSDDTDGIAELIGSCSERCDALSGFITAYADVVKIPEARLLKTNLNELMQQRFAFLESVARSATGKSLHLTLNPSEKEVFAPVDAILMEQVLVNIIKNAAESIAESPRKECGEIGIQITANPATISITDNGCGLTPAGEQHLFTPFHTTKPHGQGLGLMCIADILEKHGCTYSLTSRPAPASGATFTITFPTAPRA